MRTGWSQTGARDPPDLGQGIIPPPPGSPWRGWRRCRRCRAPMRSARSASAAHRTRHGVDARPPPATTHRTAPDGNRPGPRYAHLEDRAAGDGGVAPGRPYAETVGQLGGREPVDDLDLP